MKKKKMKEIARELIQNQLSMTYYQLENTNYKGEEIKQISLYIKKDCERMLKLINKDYYTQ